ncbi:MAG: DUF2147 domain-containing protein [Pseudomonadota bacterium]
MAGHWLTDDRASVVEIVDCGDGTPCGIVVAVHPDNGGMIADHNNRDETLRGRDMVGITLLHGFELHRNAWRRGTIYNPSDGRSYRARLELLTKDALSVSGCLGPICKKLVWERADASIDLPLEARDAEVAALNVSEGAPHGIGSDTAGSAAQDR